MAQAVTVYRWDDPGAPQIVDGRPSEFINVIKKCLVEGYGTKVGQGWTIEDESLPTDTPFLAIKNNVAAGGSGGVMMFSQSNNNATNSIRCQSALDYISPTEQSRLGVYFYCSTGGAHTSHPKNWMIIATATGFYYIAMPPSVMTRNSFGTNTHAFFYAGDFKSYYGSDPARFITLSGRSNEVATSWNSQLNNLLLSAFTSSAGSVFALDSSLSNAKSYLLTSFGNHVVSASALNNASPAIRVLSQFLLAAGSFHLGSSSGHGNNEILPFLRGEVPGLLCSQEVGFMSEAMPFFKTIDGSNYYSVPQGNSGGTNVWINVQEWP